MRIGLTGGIGSGKSTVARLLERRGSVLIDADAISRASTDAGGAAIPDIRASFGDSYITPEGALDRVRMRERVFQDPAAKTMLEAIIHPLVGQQSEKLLREAGSRSVVFDVPLLVESGRWPARVDWVWIVDCSMETQIQRVQQRNRWQRNDIEAVMNQQASRAERLAASDAVIFNENVTLDELELMVEDLAMRFGL